MPGHYGKPTIYDLLAKLSVSETTITQLNAATKNTAIDPTNVDFWAGIITVSRAIDESRTYGHGLPIPETGTVHIETIADGANVTITPAGASEVWYVQNVQLDSCEAAFKDSDGNMSPITVASANSLLPFYLTSKMSIMFNNGTGSEQTPSIAYFKVSL